MNTDVSVPVLGACLQNLAEPVGKRTHAAFLLRTRAVDKAAAEGDRTAAITALADALMNKEDGALMRHEIAYILGQIQSPLALPVLTTVLRDTADDAIVRHECAEAMGAIGDQAAAEVLGEFAEDEAPEVRDTCVLALELLKLRRAQAEEGVDGGPPANKPSGSYLSIDPAPPLEDTLSTAELRATLLSEDEGLFKRYRAMFSLRNRAGKDREAVAALCKGLEDGNALFRHEIAYVLGQVQSTHATEALVRSLEDSSEHTMVRHEAAEALGAIGGQSVEEVLRRYVGDDEAMVKESCEVAVDTMDYWQAKQYVDAA